MMLVGKLIYKSHLFKSLMMISTIFLSFTGAHQATADTFIRCIDTDPISVTGYKITKKLYSPNCIGSGSNAVEISTISDGMEICATYEENGTAYNSSIPDGYIVTSVTANDPNCNLISNPQENPDSLKIIIAKDNLVGNGRAYGCLNWQGKGGSVQSSPYPNGFLQTWYAPTSASHICPTTSNYSYGYLRIDSTNAYSPIGEPVSENPPPTSSEPPINEMNTGIVWHHNTNGSSGSNSLIGPDTPFLHVSGESQYGPIVAGGDDGKQVKRLSNYSSNQWYDIADAPFLISGLAGNQQYGPIVTNGTQVAYLNSYAANNWVIIPSTPTFPILSLSGENQYGPVVLGGEDKNEIAYVRYYNNPQWQYVAAKAPFPLTEISGNNLYGVIGFGGGDDKQVAYLRWYTGSWVVLPSHTRPIKHISGDNQYGPVIVDDLGMIYKITSYSSPSWQYVTTVNATDSGLTDLAGNNSKGPIYVGNNN